MSVRNRLVLPIAFGALLILAGCGGSGTSAPTAPPSGGFTNTSLNGTYTFSAAGADANGIFGMAGTFVACGCTAGTISSGTMDLESPAGMLPATIGSNSTYKITSDGRGVARLFYTSSGVTGTNEVDIDFVLTSSTHGLLIRYDGAGTGSGTIDLQPNAVAQTALDATPYAFSLSGSDLSSASFFMTGAFTLNSSGTITTGVADYNHNGTVSAALPLSGSVSIGSATTPGSATLTSSFGTLAFDVYAIDAKHLKFIENDGLAILVGDVMDQPTSSIAAGNYVFNASGLDSSGNLFVAAGLMTTDGTATITGGSEDVNDGGVIDNNTNPAQPNAFTGTLAASGGGRFQLNLTGFAGGTSFAAYPSSGGLLLLEIDNSGLSTGVTGGIAVPQQAGATLSTSSGYGMNLTGEDVNNIAELDEISEFKISGTSVTGLVDANDFTPQSGGSISTSNVNGTYTAPSNGTGTITFTKGGVAGIYYYPIDSSTAFFIAADTTEATLGSLEVQSAPSSAQAAIEHPRAIPMMRVLAHKRLTSQKNRSRNGSQ